MMEFPPQICLKKKKVFKRSMRKSKEVLTFPNSVESLLKTNIKLFQRNFQCLSAVHKLPISPSNPALGSKRFLFFADFFPRDLLTVNFQFLIWHSDWDYSLKMINCHIKMIYFERKRVKSQSNILEIWSRWQVLK